ncbi:hypothetical protein TNCV_187001 [Trichonephila clavipes]|nr:hypothetical protein TNCV_187001 [Trichonephila clavipes]
MSSGGFATTRRFLCLGLFKSEIAILLLDDSLPQNPEAEIAQGQSNGLVASVATKNLSHRSPGPYWRKTLVIDFHNLLLIPISCHSRSFAMEEKGDNRLVPDPDYVVDAVKLPNQAPRASGESLQTFVDWHCPDGTQHLFCCLAVAMVTSLSPSGGRGWPSGQGLKNILHSGDLYDSTEAVLYLKTERTLNKFPSQVLLEDFERGSGIL